MADDSQRRPDDEETVDVAAETEDLAEGPDEDSAEVEVGDDEAEDDEVEDSAGEGADDDEADEWDEAEDEEAAAEDEEAGDDVEDEPTAPVRSAQANRKIGKLSKAELKADRSAGRARAGRSGGRSDDAAADGRVKRIVAGVAVGAVVLGAAAAIGVLWTGKNALEEERSSSVAAIDLAVEYVKQGVTIDYRNPQAAADRQEYLKEHSTPDRKAALPNDSPATTAVIEESEVIATVTSVPSRGIDRVDTETAKVLVEVAVDAQSKVAAKTTTDWIFGVTLTKSGGTWLVKNVEIVSSALAPNAAPPVPGATTAPGVPGATDPAAPTTEPAAPVNPQVPNPEAPAPTAPPAG